MNFIYCMCDHAISKFKKIKEEPIKNFMGLCLLTYEYHDL